MGYKERGPYVDIMALHPEVTGSCNLVIVKYPNGETTKFIVDCGMFQEREYSEYNKSFPFDADNIEFCIVTHNHVDHTGRLPLLMREGFNGEILLTKQTSILLPLALYDSYKVVRDLAKRNHVRELYSEANVSQVMKNIHPCEFAETQNVTDRIRVTFFKNGHLIGAALVLVQISYPGHEDINLLFTGDYNKENMFFDVGDLPKWVYSLPIKIIQESTYGTMESTEKVETFKNNVANCVNNGGTAVCMVFSLGRFQEVLYTVKYMQDNGMIDKDIKVYLDGKLGLRYTKLYEEADLGIKEEMQDFMPENVEIVDKEGRQEIVESTQPKIIITTSGMGTYGPAQVYIPRYLVREKALLQFTGYTAEGTLGERLKSAQKGETIVIGGVVLTKRADVEYTTEFSAHAKADTMIAFLKKFENLQLVLVNHGEYGTKEAFSERILKEVQPKDVVILGRDYFYRVNSYGLIRQLSTKFE